MTDICPARFRDLVTAAGRGREASIRLFALLALAGLAEAAAAQSPAVAGDGTPAAAQPTVQAASSSTPAPAAATGSAAAARPKAVWQPLLAEPGRRIEIDRATLKLDEDGKKAEAWGRLILARPLPDAVSGTSFRVLESYVRFDCAASTFATVRRVFKKDEQEELRAEEDRIPAERPVRADSFEERVMRVACRPAGKAGERFDFKAAVGAANRAASQPPVEPPRRRLLTADLGSASPVAGAPAGRPRTAPLPPSEPAPVVRRPVPWGYAGEGGPDRWAELRPEYRLCEQGTRQSPIDVRETVAVDLPPLGFAYQPSLFRLSDRGHSLHLAVGENRLRLLGRDYLLLEGVFHRPGEVTLRGEPSPMAVHLHHRADGGQLLTLVVPLQPGAENPAVQVVLNHLPLERQQSVEPPETAIDLRDLLPADLSYVTFMGSLSTPPCTEGVQWVVLKQAVTVSAEQLAIFARRYPHNARPLQPAHGRLIKESRAL